MTNNPPPGAALTSDGVTYRVWSPEASTVLSKVLPADGSPERVIALSKMSEGWHCGTDPKGAADDAYGYVVDGKGPMPDPASRAQQSSVHGRSLVVDPSAWKWKDSAWKRPVFRDLVIYELHLGTFTPEGTFRSTMSRLAHLEALGVNAIEIMPVGDFPGERNWGYDGVSIYAPARCYGTPDDFRALVESAHAHGIAVILDVVYNHFGPDGNYVGAYSPHYFSRRHHTPWGSAFNFDGEGSAAVRDFFLRNPVYWMEEFHVDGFRFDATHEIQDDSSPHILAEMTEAVHARGGYAIAEDARNDSLMITACADGGMGFDAVWADDFHHVVRVGQTAEKHSYFEDFTGTLDEIVATLKSGWLYCGQRSKFMRGARGTPSSHLSPSGFVYCISNHDQTGNRAKGERLHHMISPPAHRMLSALLCLTPYTPMLWMGQEWGATTPFLFFTDHEVELGHKVTEGRRREFASFPEFANPDGRKSIPDPQDVETFKRSKLKWEEANAPLAELYRQCLALRRGIAAFRPASRDTWSVSETGWGAGMLLFEGAAESYLLLFDPVGDHCGPLPFGEDWEMIFSSEDPVFGGEGKVVFQHGKVHFQVPAALLFRSRAA